MALVSCTKAQWSDREWAAEAFNDCMIYSDSFNGKEVDVSEIVTKCTTYAQIIMKDKANGF